MTPIIGIGRQSATVRNRLALSFVVTMCFVGCGSQQAFQDPFSLPQISWRPDLQLDIGEAQRILGSSCRLERTTAYMEGETRAFQSTFVRESADPKTGKVGAVDYMIEEYLTADAAKAYLDTTLQENHIDPADGLLSDSGAEVHYMSGGPIVRMSMILKKNHLLRLKVNPVPGSYSLEEFRKVTEELASRL